MAGRLDMDEGPSTLGRIDLDRPLGVVVGHEGDGLRAGFIARALCLSFACPCADRSLNAAVAGSVLLYTAWQARILR